MFVHARLALLVLLLLNTLQAKFLFNDHIISPKAAEQIEKMGSELEQKSKVYAYVVATNQQLKRGVNVYDFIKKYQSSMSKPYVAIVFAPNSKRLHLISSDKELKSKLNEGTILDFAIKVIAGIDKNSLQSKYDLGLVQAYSELCDEVAKSKNIVLQSTIKSGGRWVLYIVNTLIIIGSLIVIWVYFIAPIFRKRGKR